MANKKITELPAATVPLNAGDILEIVQGGVNKQVAKSDVATGGGGTVTSVNGDAGPVVVLDATDVGADPAGSASTVNTALTNHISDTSDAHDASAISFAPAGVISATDTQAAVVEVSNETSNGREPLDVTGTAISFAVPQTYGSVATPETGNVTLVTTGLVKGCVQLLLHNHATTEPTWPTEFKRQGGVYIPAALNNIYMDPVSTTRINYWISQDIV